VSLAERLGRTLDLAREKRLYPSLIVHGATADLRRDAATTLARTLLCERRAGERPCGECRHCARIDLAAAKSKGEEEGRPFHPDVALLERERDGERTRVFIQADAARSFLRAAHAPPFEARGQVFVVAEAEALSAEAGDALLKQLEEPGLRTPRHFLLLAPSRFDLPATLRSRSQAIYLGAAEEIDAELVGEISAAIAGAAAGWVESRNPLHLLDLAARMAAAGDFSDPRASLPWTTAAAAARAAALAGGLPRAARRSLLAVASDLLSEAPAFRLRGVPAERMIEGLVSRRFAG